MTGAGERIRAANIVAWDAMQSHRFVTDIEHDRLPPDVFRRYLVFEHGFVETALQILGHAMVKAPAFAQRRRLVVMLHALSEGQLVWFDECFETLGIAPADAMPPAAVQALGDGMLGVAAEGGYADIIAVMLAAEWMYETWCIRVARGRIGDPILAAWIDLHVSPDFRGAVAWLHGEIEREAASLDQPGRDRLAALFGHALRLEIAFHEAAYDRNWPPGVAVPFR